MRRGQLSALHDGSRQSSQGRQSVEGHADLREVTHPPDSRFPEIYVLRGAFVDRFPQFDVWAANSAESNLPYSNSEPGRPRFDASLGPESSGPLRTVAGKSSFSQGRESVCAPDWSGQILFFHESCPSMPGGNVTVAFHLVPSKRYELTIMPAG